MNNKKVEGNNNNNRPKVSNKGSRQFAVKLVFSIIVGTSAILFLFYYFSPEKVITTTQEPQKKDLKNQNLAVISSRALDGDLRSPSTGTSQVRLKRGRIRESRKNRKSEQFKFYTRKDFKLSSESIILGRSQEYEVILDYVAVDDEYRERFDSSDIIGEKLERIFVKKNEASGIKSEQIVRNKRTGQIGIVTGVIVATFINGDSFKERSKIIPQTFTEVRSFEGINTVIWSGEQIVNLGQLSAVQKVLLEDQRLKKVTIEILEQGRVSK